MTPQLGLLKSTLLQLDSTFSERSYGAGSFRDFMEKLAEAGYVTLKQSERSVLVELTESELSKGADEASRSQDRNTVRAAVRHGRSSHARSPGPTHAATGGTIRDRNPGPNRGPMRMPSRGRPSR